MKTKKADRKTVIVNVVVPDIVDEADLDDFERRVGEAWLRSWLHTARKGGMECISMAYNSPKKGGVR